MNQVTQLSIFQSLKCYMDYFQLISTLPPSSSNRQSSIKIYSILLLLSISIFQTQHKQCEINPNCFEGCSNSNCIYDPSVNPFYNSSIILANQTTYNGPYCCKGCNSGYFLWNDNITCSAICNVIEGRQQWGNPLTRSCDPKCPSLYYDDPTTTKCVTKCPELYWISLNLGLCVIKCPQTTPIYFLDNKTCIESCSQGYFSYLNENNLTVCSSGCEMGSFSYYGNYSCLKVCPQNFYADLASKRCVQKCPQNQYRLNETQQCVQKCDGVLDKYGDDDSGFCVQKCPFSNQENLQLYGQNLTSKCIPKCPEGSYAHQQLFICVQKCFGSYPQQNQQLRFCEIPEIKVYLSNKQIVIVSCSVIFGIVAIVVVLILFYKLYLQKRLVRKTWTYNFMNDIDYNL